MRVSILSHSYQASENKKNIAAFGRLASVQVILQSRWTNLDNSSHKANDVESMYNVIPSVNIFGGQYVLIGFSLGLRRFKPDIILVEYNPWSSMFVQILIIRNIFCRQAKLVCLIKKNTFITKNNFFGKIKFLVATSTLKKVDHVFAASKMVANLLDKTFLVPEEKINVVTHLGVDTELFSPKPINKDNDFITIGYCGRFEPHKGVKDLIDAVKLIRHDGGEFTNIRLMFLGAGSLISELKDEQYKSTWIEVHDLVPIEEVANFLNKIDIFVMPSRILTDHQEHDAHALMEAMSCGKACIASRSGIIPELLEDDVGLLVDPGSPKSLAESLRVLILDKDRREMLGELAREKVKRYLSIEMTVQEKILIFNKLID